MKCRFELNLLLFPPSETVMKRRIRYVTSVLWLPIALIGLGCGAGPKTLNSAERDALRNRAESAHGDARNATRIKKQPRHKKLRREREKTRPDAEDTHLPPPGPTTIWADGHGATQHDAVRHGRRLVSEQIVSRIASESRVVDSMDNGREDLQASLKIKTSSSFAHAELIRTIGVVRDGRNFVARVALDRTEASKVYSTELDALRKQTERVAPALRRALTERNTAILLNTNWSPVALLSKQAGKARVLNVLGRSTKVALSADLQALAKRATAQRSRAILRLQVGGKDIPAVLKRSIVGEVSRILGERGCKFAIHDGAPPADGVPTADARLRIVTRDHQEFGALWRYVGFELYIVDARTKAPVFHLSALPEFVHGGGPSWAMADQAVVRRLRRKLKGKFARAFEAITCR